MSSTLLEERYRKVLRVLPADYRQRWADEMVTTFLDSAYADPDEDPEDVGLARPSWSEVASVLALAVRVRLGGAGGTARSTLWGAAVCRFALAGILGHAAFAVAGFAWAAIRRLAEPQALTYLEQSSSQLPTGPAALWPYALGLPWVGTYLCLVLGARRTGIGFGALTAVFSLVRLVSTFSVYQVVVDLLPLLALTAWHRDAPAVRRRPWLLALTAWHRDAPAVRRRPWLIALPVGAAVTFLPQTVMAITGKVLTGVTFPDAWALALVAAVAGYLAVALARREHLAHWSLALGLLACAVVALRMAWLVDDVAVDGFAASPAAAVSYAILLALGVALVAHAHRTAPLGNPARSL